MIKKRASVSALVPKKKVRKVDSGESTSLKKSNRWEETEIEKSSHKDIVIDWNPPRTGTAQEKFDWAVEQTAIMTANIASLQEVILEMMAEDTEFEYMMLNVSQQTIADQMGKSQQWVSDNFGPIRQKAKEEKKAKAIEMLDEGNTQAVVAEKLGVKRATVGVWARSSAKNTDNGKSSMVPGQVDPEPVILEAEVEGEFKTVEKRIEEVAYEIVKIQSFPPASFKEKVIVILSEIMK